MAQRLWNYSFQQCIYPPSNHSFTLTSSIKSCFFIHKCWNENNTASGFPSTLDSNSKCEGACLLVCEWVCVCTHARTHAGGVCMWVGVWWQKIADVQAHNASRPRRVVSLYICYFLCARRRSTSKYNSLLQSRPSVCVCLMCMRWVCVNPGAIVGCNASLPRIAEK